jgi:23S rRNA (cytosine1962-C5)-methyltransferase
MNPETIATLKQHLLTALASPPAETRRLFHGRGRCWPGLEQLTVDWLEGLLLVCVFKEPPPEQLQDLRECLLALADSAAWRNCGANCLLLQLRYQTDCPSEWLVGTAQAQRVITEHQLQYQLDLGSKQNTGLFLDMRLGRQWVREQARGLRVLNLFAYTCGFSVAAIAGGARSVVNLDMARAALSRGRDNHRLNGHDLSHVTFLGHELFKSWGKVRRLGPYDLILIDPPSFQKGSFALTEDYARVLRRIPELLTAHGQVLACVNDPAIGPDFIVQTMAREAPQLVFRKRLDNPCEFPDVDPASGLKALVFSEA